MQITTALNGSLERNLRLSPGDEVTLELTVYQNDGDSSSLAYTNPIMEVSGTASYPIGAEFTIPLDLGRTPYRLTVEISGDTTTVAYGVIETTMPGSCSIVCACPPSGGGSSSVTNFYVSGQIISTMADGTPPMVLTSAALVENLNAEFLGGATFAAPGPIGGTTPGSASFTTVSAETSVTTPIVKAPTGGNVSIEAPNGVTIGSFNGTTGLFTAPFNLKWTGYQETSETTAPSAPSTNGVRIYAQDNGAGKTQLMALFSSGAAVQIAIQP